ncbi:hypothetical protein ACFXKX_20800 [Streptomyces scopuliridis]|uniref:hypothetical protein n=1 Tax=Streptomyces scopuliridis TaxID=452529 RepID=UPI00369DE2E2
MARTVAGGGKVTLLPLLYMWPDRYAVLAYATVGAYGTTAVVGYVPVPGVPDLDLMDTAVRHQPTRLYGSAGGSGFAEACWLICVGWSARSVPKPGTLELHEATWSLNPDSTTELGRTMYGHDRLHTGRLTLDDPGSVAQARGVLPCRTWGPGPGSTWF